MRVEAVFGLLNTAVRLSAVTTTTSCEWDTTISDDIEEVKLNFAAVGRPNSIRLRISSYPLLWI
jgi:hypothetical protein